MCRQLKKVWDRRDYVFLKNVCEVHLERKERKSFQREGGNVDKRSLKVKSKGKRVRVEVERSENRRRVRLGRIAFCRKKLSSVALLAIIRISTR